MPELPEVETHIVELRPLLEGRRIESASVSWARTIAEPEPDRFRQLIRGRRFEDLQRRAKYMLLGLDAGWTLVVHLRMTGTLRVVPSDRERDKHVQVVLGLEGGEELRYLDTRKFGRFWLVRDPDRVLPPLGPEPLSPAFTGRWLHGAMARRQAAVKARAAGPAGRGGGGQHLRRRGPVSGAHPSRAPRGVPDPEGMPDAVPGRPPCDQNRHCLAGQFHLQLCAAQRCARPLSGAAPGVPPDRGTLSELPHGH